MILLLIFLYIIIGFFATCYMISDLVPDQIKDEELSDFLKTVVFNTIAWPLLMFMLITVIIIESGKLGKIKNKIMRIFCNMFVYTANLFRRKNESL